MVTSATHVLLLPAVYSYSSCSAANRPFCMLFCLFPFSETLPSHLPSTTLTLNEPAAVAHFHALSIVARIRSWIDGSLRIQNTILDQPLYFPALFSLDTTNINISETEQEQQRNRSSSTLRISSAQQKQLRTRSIYDHTNSSLCNKSIFQCGMSNLCRVSPDTMLIC